MEKDKKELTDVELGNVAGGGKIKKDIKLLEEVRTAELTAAVVVADTVSVALDSKEKADFEKTTAGVLTKAR